MEFFSPIAISVFVFLFVLGSIIFEFIDKALVVLLGVVILLFTGVLSPEEVLPMVDSGTILLLMGMMILVEGVRESRILSWMNVKIIEKTEGNPLLLFFIFSFLTFFLSTFLANATTMMVIIPLTIAVTQGIGISPKPYLISEIFFANIGGTLTLIGDPTNVMIGSANGFSFLTFLQNMWIPISLLSTAVISLLVFKDWEVVKPIKKSLPKLFMSNLLIQKIKEEFVNEKFSLPFAIKTAIILSITVLMIIIQPFQFPIEYIAVSGAVFLLVFLKKYLSPEKVFAMVDWHTLLFFSGLFIVVGTLEKVGALEKVSEIILHFANSPLTLGLSVLWAIGLLSGFVENIPLVAMMIPVLKNIIASGQITGNLEMVWFALSLGACLGGNGSLIGSSASMIGAQMAERYGVKISFREFFKYGFPVTILSLSIASVFLFFVL
ncbi:MAG: SLC13 family permease [Candidatus Peregrinibacteria bacterium]